MTLTTDDSKHSSSSSWLANMHIPLNGHTANGWAQPVDNPGGAQGIMDYNPSSFLDSSTPKAQPTTDSSWNQYSGGATLNTNDWSLHTEITPTGTDMPWGTQDVMPKFESRFDAQPQVTHTQKRQQNVGPMPIPERSCTEPLWQRRLNAKNKELNQLHSRLSVPDVNEFTHATTSERGNGITGNTGRRHTAWSQGSTLGVMDHDFTHASPNTLRMLGIDSTSFAPASRSASVSVSGASSNSPHTNNESASVTGMPAFNNSGSSNQDFAAQMALMQSLNANTVPGHVAMHSSSLPQADSVLPMDFNGHQSPRSTRRSLQDTAVHGRRGYGSGESAASYMDPAYQSSAGFDMDNSAAYISAFASPQTANTAASNTSTSLSSNGKGVINKVIVPPTHGAPTDAIDLRTGEAGQMRHMCPHPGCDKHFSTSGHARRHSRIHDCLRPFECPHDGCHATFTRRDNCTQHQRARHKFQLVAHRIGDED